jgi:predicted nucleic-acid-binding Zn-ribbon protein
VYRSQGKGVDSGIRADDGSLMLNIRHIKKIFDDFKLLYFESYVCSQCGYLELYVEDLEELVKVETADNWEKVAPS